jgi:hypothetical protein
MLLRLVVAGAAASLAPGAVVRALQSRSWCRSPPVMALFLLLGEERPTKVRIVEAMNADWVVKEGPSSTDVPSNIASANAIPRRGIVGVGSSCTTTACPF